MLFYNIHPVGIILEGVCVISSIKDLEKIFFPQADTHVLFQDETDIRYNMKSRIYIDTSVFGGYFDGYQMLEIRSPKDFINYEQD